MFRLHGLLYHTQQPFAQLSQIDLIAQCRTKVGQHVFRIMPAAIKAAINHVLDGPTQRLEERCDCQGRDDN